MGRKSGPLRNTEIVNLCTGLVAFWDLKSRGTADVLRKAFSQDKVLRVYGPDGSQQDLDHVRRLLDS